ALSEGGRILLLTKGSTGIVLVLLGFVSYYRAMRSVAEIATPLQRVTSVLRSVSDGDFQKSLPAHASEDEVGQLHRVCEGLLTFLKGLADGARQMADGNLTDRL